MVSTGSLSLQVPYRVFPLRKPFPGLPDLKETWAPILRVAIIVGHVTSKRFEAVVDSGSAVCLFHAQIGQQLGLKLKEGDHDKLGGVVGAAMGDVWYHEIRLKVMADTIPIVAGFSEQLSVAAILCRHGFFEHFTVTFDPSSTPPGFSIERVHRT